jgi:hypothetical protein
MKCPQCGSEDRLFSNCPSGYIPDETRELKEKIAALEKEKADAVLAERDRCERLAKLWETPEQVKFGKGGLSAAIREGRE